MQTKQYVRELRGARGARGMREVRDAIAQALAEHVPDGVRQGELDRGGRVLRWVEAGRGGPPVVLVAGNGTSSLTWAPVLPELAAHGRIVAYDRAGLGASDPDGATGPSLESPIGDLAALVEHLDAGPAVLVGHSWGGQLAQLLAWKRPELVAGLVLVDPAHEEFQPPAIRVAEAVLLRLWQVRAAVAPAARDAGDSSRGQRRPSAPTATSGGPSSTRTGCRPSRSPRSGGGAARAAARGAGDGAERDRRAARSDARPLDRPAVAHCRRGRQGFAHRGARRRPRHPRRPAGGRRRRRPGGRRARPAGPGGLTARAPNPWPDSAC